MTATRIAVIASQLPEDGLLAINPAMIHLMPDDLPDVPAGIIIPQYDKDVPSLDTSYYLYMDSYLTSSFENVIVHLNP